ncbi:hypothetical protein EYF80_062959 [Liparis tanakae]|uniref:Uncharacterized protein n=1 Tax=Liparis tanakae TaxID=230148 RepID=A0A4Z2EDG3_9TELE|nr:hypothetical protein EYF80_062959 [Liparis tanakae]
MTTTKKDRKRERPTPNAVGGKITSLWSRECCRGSVPPPGSTDVLRSPSGLRALGWSKEKVTCTPPPSTTGSRIAQP